VPQRREELLASSTISCKKDSSLECSSACIDERNSKQVSHKRSEVISSSNSQQYKKEKRMRKRGQSFEMANLYAGPRGSKIYNHLQPRPFVRCLGVYARQSNEEDGSHVYYQREMYKCNQSIRMS
jgi:hypothetical protein